LADKSYAAESGEPRRILEFTFFFAAMVWAVCANEVAGRAADGIAGRLAWTSGIMLLKNVFLLLLLALGFRVLEWGRVRSATLAQTLSLPARETAPREWITGFAVGWGLCLVAVFPLLLSGHLTASFNWGAGVPPAVLLALATVFVGSLVEEVVLRGFAFRRLMRAVGPSWACLLVALAFAGFQVYANRPANTLAAFLCATLFGLLLGMAYLRTYGLWLGWGVRFGYTAVMSVVLGLPINGRSSLGAVLDSSVSGPRWLSGGRYALDGAYLTPVFLLVALVVMYRITRDWAWDYTLQVILPAGYEVTVAPPAAHVAMEKAAAPPPLVQILAATPAGFSAVEASSGTRVATEEE
jgi:membrane protease YdiL (CAAX protease family)